MQILMLAATVLWPRSVLRFSFACGLRPHAKLNPRTPLTPTSPMPLYFFFSLLQLHYFFFSQPSNHYFFFSQPHLGAEKKIVHAIFFIQPLYLFFSQPHLGAEKQIVHAIFFIQPLYFFFSQPRVTWGGVGGGWGGGAVRVR